MNEYIVFEGSDGVGKSSVKEKVSEILDGVKFEPSLFGGYNWVMKTHTIREPEEPFREFIFENNFSYEQQLLLFFADRLNSARKIKEVNTNSNLNENNYNLLLSDRSWISSLVYQVMYGEAFNINFLSKLYNEIDLPSISKVIVIDSQNNFGDIENSFDELGEEIRENYRFLCNDYTNNLIRDEIKRKARNESVGESMANDIKDVDLVQNKSFRDTVNRIIDIVLQGKVDDKGKIKNIKERIDNNEN